MGCRCGSSRTSSSVADSAPVRQPSVAPRRPEPAYFQYQGVTALTAIGPVSRRRYRFLSPGAIVAVDGRDAPSLAGVPHLRRLRDMA